MPDPTCSERISAMFARTMSDLRKIDLGDIEALMAHALSFDYIRAGENGNPKPCFRWQLSWGGPQDEFLFPFNRHVIYVGKYTPDDDGLRWNPSATTQCQYWLRDWGDSAHVNLSDGHLRILKEVINTYGYHNYAIDAFKQADGIAPRGEQGEGIDTE